MTTPDDRPTDAGAVPAPEPDDTPAWADADAFAEAAAEEGFDAFTHEQGSTGQEPEVASSPEPAATEPSATEPTASEPATEPTPEPTTEPASEPGPDPEPEPATVPAPAEEPPTTPAEVPFEAPGPEPLEAPGPEPLEVPAAEPVRDSGSQVPGSALTGDQVAGERVVAPSAPPVLPHVPEPPATPAPPAPTGAPTPAPPTPATAAPEDTPAAAPATTPAADAAPLTAAGLADTATAPSASEPATPAQEDHEQLADVDVVPAPGPRTGPLTAVVAVLAVLALVLGVLAWRAAGPGPLQHDRDAALDAARSAARVVFSYDYRHLEQDFAAGRAVTTGEFRKEYERTTGKLVDNVAARYKAVVVADVGAAGVVTASPGRVLVLVYVDQQSASTLTAQPRLTQSRLEMTMVEHGSHWLVEKIRAF